MTTQLVLQSVTTHGAPPRCRRVVDLVEADSETATSAASEFWGLYKRLDEPLFNGSGRSCSAQTRMLGAHNLGGRLQNPPVDARGY